MFLKTKAAATAKLDKASKVMRMHERALTCALKNFLTLCLSYVHTFAI
jgi:hypothetical protein